VNRLHVGRDANNEMISRAGGRRRSSSPSADLPTHTNNVQQSVITAFQQDSRVSKEENSAYVGDAVSKRETGRRHKYLCYNNHSYS